MAVVAATWADSRSIWTAYWAVEYAAVFRVEGVLLVTTHIVVDCGCAWHFGWRGELTFARGNARAVTVT